MAKEKTKNKPYGTWYTCTLKLGGNKKTLVQQKLHRLYMTKEKSKKIIYGKLLYLNWGTNIRPYSSSFNITNMYMVKNKPKR